MCSNQDSEPREVWDSSNSMFSKRRLDRSEEEDGLDEPQNSRTGLEVNFSGDLPEPLHPDQLLSYLAALNKSNRSRSEDCIVVSNESVKQSRHTATELSNRRGATSTVNTIGLGLTNDSSPSSPYRSKNMTTKVSESLEHGFLNPAPPMADFLRPDSRGTDRAFPSRPVPLSLFPPRSPLTGNREYTPPNSPFLQSVSPISPLNNGRDVYGNYIPSNTRDYFTTQLLSSSPNSQPIIEYEAPSVSKKSSSTSRLYGSHWNKLKLLWKVADTQAPNPQVNPCPLQLIPGEDIVPQGIPIVTYAGRSSNQAPPSIRSRLLTSQSTTDLHVIDSVKSRPSTTYTSRSDAKDTNSQTRTRQLADKNRIPVDNSRSNAMTGNGRIAPRDEKRWHKDNLPPPPRVLPAPPPKSVQGQHRNVSLSLYTAKQSHGVKSLVCNEKKDSKPNNRPKNESSGICRNVENDRETRYYTEKQQQLSRETGHECQESLVYREKAHKQKHDLIMPGSEDGTTKTTTVRDMDSRFEMKPMVDSDLQSSKIPAASSPSLPCRSPIPVSPQYPSEQVRDPGTVGHSTFVPSPTPVASIAIQKHQPSLRSVLSKAGELSRSVLISPFEIGSKSGSQYHRLVDLDENEPIKLGMSADSNGWPRSCSSNPRKEMAERKRGRANGMRKIEGLDPERYLGIKGSGRNEYLSAPAVSNDTGGSQSSIFTKRRNVPNPGIEPASTSNLTDIQDRFQAGLATRNKADGALHSKQTTQEWLDSIVSRTSTTTQPTLNRSSDSNDETDHPSHHVLSRASTEANSLAAQYQALTTGALNPSFTPTLSTHDKHENLDSATQEALLVADRIRQYDARFSADGEGTMIRSSFSSDSSDEVTQQEEEEEKKKKKKKKRKKHNLWGRQDFARVMTLMHSYE
ncbi:hypothetical protein COCMIDRAFT_32600 [Bipolaris oryzae ATCC 44560]|uniref:Uncharacterized protein n=1 Tax=Bipolaris oryzae ATCC 44560 TaxID=930090 RepID=W6ZJ40_COCMI|nr:uncharacterized protein COCMIDRAFT_32600 [Bipolaris oryzae ATCC 44560]EUC50028.1 hypothetical protein COCMIDRAFT_32600 [Bipolaris oryzae ATCC 44560]